MARLSIIALALALISSVTAAQTAYIRFIDGGANALNDTVTAGGETGFIEIDDYSFNIQSADPTASGGAGAGKASASPLQFSSKVDRNAVKFFRYQTSGRTFDSVVLKIISGNVAAAKYTFSTAVVIDQTINGTTGADFAEQIVSVSYEKIQLQVSTVEADGSLSPSEGGGWDRTTNSVTTVVGSP